ncbi:SDR family NAD(P)-dependent oxidoreductase [Paracoccus marinaquae]|uniref:SDR family NAD(P)-dependent oxidoreductase n=1 Tax=Paracoccus marinaquae TaxID=2841926 RepID=A0ABS6AKH8_9RHOB|nr:SDR family NAD(P)-dependent oxidoreductase [Paracoccus marinaquae]MBU3031085.1 SDR family NAD(P)-dependent oxidoreductase [Paracoccus marinaquae]
MSKLSFKDKHVVVTGGNSGLGLALAKALAGQGARLTLMARDADKLASAAGEITAAYPGAVVNTQSLDVTNEEAAAAAMNAAAEAQGGIDALINNAGILREGYFQNVPMEVFRQVMEINYFGVLNATRAALPHLQRSKGRLINVASMAGLVGAFGYSPYCASKHALVGLTSCLRYELEPMGITVQLICPAEFDSPMVDELDKTRTPENRAHVLTIPKATLDGIVTGVMKGLDTDRYEIVPTGMARAGVKLSRFAPGLLRRSGNRAIAGVYRGPVAASV